MTSPRPTGLIAQRLRRFSTVLFLGLSLTAGAAFADPPGRVGRIAEIEGRVWLFDAETNEWVAALRNRPLTAGDRLSTDGEARAVLRVGPTSLLVDGQTEMEVLQLDDERVRLQVHSGSIALRLRTRETALEYQVLTNEGTFSPERAGHYRIDRRDDISYANVWQGQLRYEGRGQAMSLGAGQRAELMGDGSRLIALGNDAFTDWVMRLETREERSVSERYVSPEMTGAEELDRYGRWEQSPDYGAVWIPQQVAVGWAPYRQGRWVSVAPWGWTWVDDAPWGFAPFHYGRWAQYRGVWCWVPGTYVRRPVYAPALVAWVGGPQVSVGVNVGPHRPPVVGWFPLGPREVYVPGYRVSPGYVRNVNIHHVPDVGVINRAIDGPRRPPHEYYGNRDGRDAITVAPVGQIGRGQHIDRIADQGTVQELIRGPVHSDPGLPVRVAPEGRDRPRDGSRPGIPRADDDRGPRRSLPVVAVPAPQTVPSGQSALRDYQSGVPLVAPQPREPMREPAREAPRERPSAAVPNAVIPSMPIPAVPSGPPMGVRDRAQQRDEQNMQEQQRREQFQREQMQQRERAAPPPVMPQREAPQGLPMARPAAPPSPPAAMPAPPTVQRGEPPRAPAPPEARKPDPREEQGKRDKDGRRDRISTQ
nr:DUF6600 domain-containing protein [uncultured Roseateles sp.]